MTPMRDIGDEGAALYPDLFEIGFDINATLEAIEDVENQEQAAGASQPTMLAEPMDQV